MAYDVQVTIDCAQPHEQAKWWAETLGWQVEPTDGNFVRGLVEKGHAREEDTVVFEGNLVWKIGAAIANPDNPNGPRILFQSVPEPKTVKNRQHLDVRVGDDREAVAKKLGARGARILHRGSQGPFDWITMADPEGNEFCLT
ncbi:VOC family protein [Rhodococcus sp. Eu-32]|uniref:VOC family protein n=1 Tax=Rhodococcus sp. Eu-32 TaxID=1017319 RepID=UPI000DF4A3D2|nr:VOC family protein [Rhodococcus sp. Eu-32]RRQ28208.1 VOC family protein [Rhodococcus sp. Eu-32]